MLPSFKQPGPEGTTFFNRPLPPFHAHAWSAVVNVAIEPDGLVRRYAFGQKLDGEFLPSMGAVLAGQYDEKRGPFLIDFAIKNETIPRVSFIDVLNGNHATLDALKDKKVISRRHRARTWRSLQYSKRRHRLGAGAASARRQNRLSAAVPCTGLRQRRR